MVPARIYLKTREFLPFFGIQSLRIFTQQVGEACKANLPALFSNDPGVSYTTAQQRPTRLWPDELAVSHVNTLRLYFSRFVDGPCWLCACATWPCLPQQPLSYTLKSYYFVTHPVLFVTPDNWSYSARAQLTEKQCFRHGLTTLSDGGPASFPGWRELIVPLRYRWGPACFLSSPELRLFAQSHVCFVLGRNLSVSIRTASLRRNSS